MAGGTISHYRLIDEIASGDGGVVYLAEDVRLHREVAIKVPHGEAADQPAAFERFHREARIASSVSHPNICAVHDVGEDEGQPFMVLERLQGASLDRILSSGPLPINRAIDLAVDLCDALEAVHAKGLVHGNVVPANVFVTSRGGAKLLDFGTATPIGQDGAAHSAAGALTAAGVSLPPADTSLDTRSLGALLHLMVSGRPPAQGTETTDSAVVLPSGVNAIVARALTTTPQRGYPDIAAMRDALQALAFAPPHDRRSSLASARALFRGRRGRRRLRLVAGVLAVLSVAGAATWWWWTRPPATAPLTDRDSVLIGAFANTTGDAVFEDTLRHALAMHLSQSPFLSIVGDDRIGETLRLMGRPASSAVTPDIARELCERVGAQAAIEGSIAPREDGGYDLGLVAVACKDGRTLASQTVEAPRKEDVIGQLGRAATALRPQLGESLPSLDRFDVPIERATTSSLEALRAYTLGVHARAVGQESEAIPHFERAVELDPRFAAAFNALSMIYGSAGDAVRGAEYARRAFETSGGVSERERFLILFQYHDRVTGELERVESTLKVWEQSYPRDFSPSNGLAVVYNRTGRFDEAVARAREARQRAPDHPFPYSNLSYAHRGLNQWQDAKAVATQAVERGIATVPTRRLLYQLALQEGDATAADRQLRALHGRDREFDMVGAHAQALAFAGRRREALARYDEARTMADQGRFSAVAAGYALQAAWSELLLGYPPRAAARATPLLSSGDMGVRLGAATILALARRPGGMAQVAEASLRERPADTLNVGVSVPMVRAALAHGRGDFTGAIAALAAARPYELGRMAALGPVWLRGIALLSAGQPAEAAVEFGRVLEHRGTEPFSIFYAVAPLWRGRSLAAEGRRDEAAQAYANLFEQWHAADPDLAALLDARDEAARLARRNAPAGRAEAPSPGTRVQSGALPEG